LLKVLDDAMQVQVAAGIDPTTDEDNEPLLDEQQFYITRVGFSIAHAITWLEQLNHAVYFIGDFKYGGKAKQEGVNRVHHLIYNIENYLIRLQSVYDRMLQLVNRVFHICTSDELVSHSLIVSNLHVARTKVPKVLRNLRKRIEPLAKVRNDVIHKHSLIDKDLRRLDLFYMHTESTWRPRNDRMPFKNLAYVRSQLMKKVSTAKRAEFEATNSDLFAAVEPLFNELLAEYERQKKRLR